MANQQHPTVRKIDDSYSRLSENHSRNRISQLIWITILLEIPSIIPDFINKNFEVAFKMRWLALCEWDQMSNISYKCDESNFVCLFVKTDEK